MKVRLLHTKEFAGFVQPAFVEYCTLSTTQQYTILLPTPQTNEVQVYCCRTVHVQKHTPSTIGYA